MLVYLALARFRKRPILSQLPVGLRRDMKAFFGAYSRACAEADALLFQAGDAAAIDEACRRSTIGKLLPDDLYVHRSALDALEPRDSGTRTRMHSPLMVLCQRSILPLDCG
jgi:DNA phosphorothioation-associated putative methyltransferase